MDPDAAAADLEAVFDVPVTVSAVLGKSAMEVSQLLKLGKGTVVELDRKVGEAIDIYVNNRLVARGEVVVVQEPRSATGVRGQLDDPCGTGRDERVRGRDPGDDRDLPGLHLDGDPAQGTVPGLVGKSDAIEKILDRIPEPECHQYPVGSIGKCRCRNTINSPNG